MPQVKNPLMQFPGHMESVLSEVGSRLKKRGISVFEVIERAAKPEGESAIETIVDALTALTSYFRFDRRIDPWNWRLLEDVPQTITPAGLELVPLSESQESYVGSDLMSALAVELGANCGQHDAEFLLENQHLVPVELRGRCHLVFPGTKWRDLNGRVRISCICWNGDEPCLTTEFLDNNFKHTGFLVRPRKV